MKTSVDTNFHIRTGSCANQWIVSLTCFMQYISEPRLKCFNISRGAHTHTPTHTSKTSIPILYNIDPLGQIEIYSYYFKSSEADLISKKNIFTCSLQLADDPIGWLPNLYSGNHS